MSEQIPFRDGMLTEPLSPPENVRLKGVECRSCGAMALGHREHCINCAGSDVEGHTFSNYGEVYSHTIIRHPPPPPFPKDKFQPFPVAWVKLEEGLFIVSELTDVGLDDVEFGMPVELIVGKGWEDENGNDVMMYKFRPRK